MSQALATAQTNQSAANNQKALKILAKSVYKELRQNGYEPKQVVALASELISLVTSDIDDGLRLD